jgi:hypothetical protein
MGSSSWPNPAEMPNATITTTTVRISRVMIILAVGWFQDTMDETCGVF